MIKKFHKVIDAAGHPSLVEGYTYEVAQQFPGGEVYASIGGKFSTLVDYDQYPVEFEVVEQPVPTNKWRNPYAIGVWEKVFMAEVTSDASTPFGEAADLADAAVAEFMKRWEGDTFIKAAA